jgi:hypothetical protein
MMDELLVEKGLSHQLSFCLSGPPNICKRGGGVVELDNEVEIGLGYVLESMDGGVM